jgi:hypothetical protein
MGGSGSLDQLAPAFGRAWGDGTVMRSLVRDTISLENQLRFGGVTPLADVEGVSFDRPVLGRLVLVWMLVWLLLGSPFELPDVCGDPPFG